MARGLHIASACRRTCAVIFTNSKHPQMLPITLFMKSAFEGAFHLENHLARPRLAHMQYAGHGLFSIIFNYHKGFT